MGSTSYLMGGWSFDLFLPSPSCPEAWTLSWTYGPYYWAVFSQPVAPYSPPWVRSPQDPKQSVSDLFGYNQCLEDCTPRPGTHIFFEWVNELKKKCMIENSYNIRLYAHSRNLEFTISQSNQSWMKSHPSEPSLCLYFVWHLHSDLLSLIVFNLVMSSSEQNFCWLHLYLTHSTYVYWTLYVLSFKE